MSHLSLEKLNITPTGNLGTPVGDQVLASFQSGTDQITLEVNETIAAAADNPTDPTNMIQMQVALANYGLALQVQSSIVKSLEETAKSITQKL